jgi:hypothetical protein
MGRVDNLPASIFLDLDMRQQAGDPALPNMGYIRVYMISPRDDGLSSNEEAPRLGELEDALEATLCVEPSTIFVGRNTTDGFRDLIFYTKDALTWASRVDSAMSPHRDYKYDSGCRPDPEWKVYCDFLFPTDVELQRMGNRRVCYSLQDHGDALVEPRDIQHWIYLPTDAARDAYIDWALKCGFLARKTENNRGNLPFGLCLSRTDLPSLAAIDGVTLPLYEKAIELSGTYDGWESLVVRHGEPKQG